MSSSIIISNPQIIINNVTYFVIPNSSKYRTGHGTANMRATTAGGGIIKTAYAQNLEEAVGYFTCEMSSEDINIDVINTFRALLNKNAITFFQTIQEVEFHRTMQNAALVNDPEITMSSEGTFTLEFKGDKFI